MTKLDRTEQRIVGVLIEKELSVPDSYPLSENALEAGCNQKNNREPVTELLPFQIAGALMALQEKGFVARVEGGSRVAKFRHRAREQLQLDQKEVAVLAELLLRGPQASGALKPRVARMGCHGSPEEIEAMLRRLGERRPPLVELLPLAPRERERRWRHLVGDGSELQVAAAVTPAATYSAYSARDSDGDGPSDSRPATPATPTVDAARLSALEQRLTTLEQEVPSLQQQIASLRDAILRLQSPNQGD